MDFNLTIVNNDTLSVYFNIFQNIQHSYFHVEYIFDSANDKYDMVYANKTLDTCKFFANLRLNLFMQMVIKTAENYGNIPKRCPLQKV